MKVGLLTASSSRQAGGLFWAMAPLARQLSKSGCQVEVFAGRDRHSEDDRPPWGKVPLHVFDKVGPAAFGFTPGLSKSLGDSELDVLHTHGLWMYPSVAAQTWGRRTGKPWLVSPHGMLDPWAIRNARWKKHLAGIVYENQNLRGAAALHALCDAEAEVFRAYGLTSPIAVIPNGVDLPVFSEKPVDPGWATTLPEGARVLLFLGRLHPKKGIPSLLEAWAQVAGSTDEPWCLVIAGWDQNAHRAELEQMVVSLGIQGSVRFVGPQFGGDKATSLARADGFVLPSFSEGVPVAVLEAWTYQLPVLMTPQCNLPSGFAAGAAISMEPEVDAIGKGLSALFGMTQQDREQMGARGRRLVEECFSWGTIAAEMCSVYHWLLGQAERPACVGLD